MFRQVKIKEEGQLFMPLPFTMTQLLPSHIAFTYRTRLLATQSNLTCLGSSCAFSYHDNACHAVIRSIPLQ